MALAEAFVTLGQLYERDDGSQILDKIKGEMACLLPDGWQNYKVVDLSKEELVGRDPDGQLLNKLRYAIPTMVIAKAFDQEGTHLSERPYRNYKVKMLDWAFCRGLILSPPNICNALRGSAAAAEIFNKAVLPLNHLFISRKEASKKLQQEQGSSEDEEEIVIPLPKKSRFDLLEDKMFEMFSSLKNEIQTLQERPSTSKERIESDSGEEYWSDNMQEEEEDSREGSGSVASVPFLVEEMEFEPQVKEAEPHVARPDPEIWRQGVNCQKFHSTGWNNIRYKEVQKKLEASPVFSALKVNPQLEEINQKSYSQTLLIKSDLTLGTITHGLLQQRQALKRLVTNVAIKHPEAANELKSGLFSAESEYKTISDELLQLTCARRAETIDARRKCFKPRKNHMIAEINKIPPSETYLFEQQALNQLLKDEGGLFRTFYGRPQRAATKNQNTTFHTNISNHNARTISNFDRQKLKKYPLQYKGSQQQPRHRQQSRFLDKKKHTQAKRKY